MAHEKFITSINAPREKVWDILWDDKSYREWTSVFSEGSRVETSWEEGSKVLFLDGKGSGMVSRIAKNKAPEFMSFEHLGEVKDGIEDTTSEKVKNWSGAFENYTLRETNGNTTLEVDLDISDDFKEYFTETFPKALKKVKELAEGNQ